MTLELTDEEWREVRQAYQSSVRLTDPETRRRNPLAAAAQRKRQRLDLCFRCRFAGQLLA